jgi:hypothetical protein
LDIAKAGPRHRTPTKHKTQVALILLMAICPAPARATELPKHMLGLWCFNKIATEELDTDNISVWDKATSFDDCAIVAASSCGDKAINRAMS